MKTNQKWIPLKEAAKISGYSADYIGYLIRRGKIPGKPVYSRIVWMTTAEAILKYKNREQKKKKKLGFKEKILDFFTSLAQSVFWEIRLFKLFVKTFKYVLPIIIILILSFSALMFFILSTKFQKTIPEEQIIEEIQEEKEAPPFLTY